MKKLKMLLLGSWVAWSAVMLLAGCASHSETQPEVVRQRFVPGPSDSSGGGANWTALQQFAADQPGVLTVMAHAGIGGRFPVQEEHRPRVFEVTVVEGDDEHLVLEVRRDEGSQRLRVQRDGTARAQVAGNEYVFAYPSVTVRVDSKPTTDKALILVHRVR